MRINHFLPFFVCSVILLFLCPPSKSPLHRIFLSFYSSSSCSIVLLCFCSIVLQFFSSFTCLLCITFFCHSVLLLLCLSLNFMLNIFSFLLSNCFVLFPFRTANPIQSRSFSFIHTSLTIPLPLPLGKTRTFVIATETLTDLSLSVHFF